MPDSPLETYKRLLQQAERAADAGVREWAAPAMPDAIDLGEEQGDAVGRGGGAVPDHGQGGVRGR